MKVLFVSTHFPTNPQHSTTGTFKRMRTFLDALRESATLRILFFCNERFADAIPETIGRLRTDWGLSDVEIDVCREEPEPEHSDSLWKGYFVRALSIHRQLGYVGTSGPKQIAALDRALSDSPDLVFAHRLAAMCPLMLTTRRLPPVFMDLDDVEHKAFLRRIRQPPHWLGKRLFYLQLPALKAGERRALQTARKTFVCSHTDRQYLERKWAPGKVAVVPNSIVIPDAQPLTDAPVLLLLGAYGYAPNAVAAEELIMRIWPLIHSACPQAKLVVAGANPEFIRRPPSPDPSIEYTGFVENLDALYQRARVVCCPIRSGGGTRIKIIEAAAYGKPIVSTRIGAEGLDFIDGQEILLRDDVEGFARACVDLLTDKSRGENLGSAAREKAAALYDRKNVIARIEAEVLGAVRQAQLAGTPADVRYRHDRAEEVK